PGYTCIRVVLSRAADLASRLNVFLDRTFGIELVEMPLDFLCTDKGDLQRHELRRRISQNVGRNAEPERVDQFRQLALRLSDTVTMGEGEDAFL
ncbi:MAG TPA: hypothetical protein PKZ32_05100, partial [Candidatus Melainabacteria bacterium]|nr:hypothetical protein [Candidatus Melainabacteria bacterium]